MDEHSKATLSEPFLSIDVRATAYKLSCLSKSSKSKNAKQTNTAAIEIMVHF